MRTKVIPSLMHSYIAGSWTVLFTSLPDAAAGEFENLYYAGMD
jgi:hypothetical protein